MNEKRQKIIEATIRLLERDGTAVPTAKVAKEAGVSNGTLFNYFATKQDLLDGVYLYVKEEMADAIMSLFDDDDSAKSMMKKLWCAYIVWAKDNMSHHRVCFLLASAQVLSPEVLNQADEIFQASIDRLEEAMKAGEIITIPSDYLKVQATTGVMSTVDYIAATQMEDDLIEGFVETSFNMFWNSLQV